MLPYKRNLKPKSRGLRKNMTPAEIKLWSRIRKKQIYGLQFYRQKPLGKYIVDFYCPAKKLVIEVDGGHHYYDDKQIKIDKQRDKYLRNKLDLKILRFSNPDVLENIDDVIEDICHEL